MSTFEVRYQLDWETVNKVKTMDGSDAADVLRRATEDLMWRYGDRFVISQIDEMYR